MCSNINPRKTISALLLALCLVTALSSAGMAQPVSRVLLLNSYNQDLLWTAAVTRGVQDAIATEQGAVKLFIEYMDTKNFYSPEYMGLLKKKYAFKYVGKKIDVIIASDDNAADFALMNRAELFGNAPVVFCGVNDLDFPMREDFKRATGVLEFTDVSNTVHAALDLQPNLKQMYVIHDDTTTGRFMRAMVENTIPTFKDQIEFRWITGKSMAEVKKEVAVLPPDSAILLIMYNRDSLGDWYTYAETIAQLAPVANSPIYGMWDFYLDRGIVGGMITSGGHQGSIAAQMALDILGGRDPESMPVVLQKSNQYMFDHAVLQRYGLDPDRLPKNAVLINVPETIYDKFAFEIWTIAAVIFMLTGVILVLLVNNRARRTVERELEELNRYQETLIEDRTDELLQRSRELERANIELQKLDSLKTNVLNTVSHDLRTPLTSVLGFCKLVHRDFVSYFKPLAKRDETLTARGDRIIDNLEIVELEGERLTRLINDFLDLSKIESDDMVWSDIRLDVKELIESATPMLNGYFRDTDVTLFMEFGDNIPLVAADPDRLLQVVNNLVGNAAKFTDAGTVTIRAEGENGFVAVSVADTGVGIPPEDIDAIFETFYQVADPGSGRRIARGSGMGLAISKRIVEHYGGTIGATSVLGVGSVFTFRLPAAE